MSFCPKFVGFLFFWQHVNVEIGDDPLEVKLGDNFKVYMYSETWPGNNPVLLTCAMLH